ncbi:saccharopine dehydrogenase family protein [Haloarcula salina]|uniref:Saccharopine dehydrogenase NADP-binding domain-containing protein n=1 Tax=Haloarcula salina TaxID=1429914 RepID=A0AA41G4N2_9EURY|nr:saccharopine dehydrogenase NADP-binding domain-containing protein [Haloarcula salina]MBV0903526.1 saccharopine dehydrogenase NADP-binding domain-containing protein [Haloarcula salina]
MTDKTVVLGGSGAMTSGCVYDLHKTSDFDEIVVADADEDNARRLIETLDDDRFRFESVDATDADDIAGVLEGADYVVNGLPYQFEENVLDAMAQVGDLTGVDLNAFDFDDVLSRSEEFAEAGNSLWFANGGLVSTIALGMAGCETLDDVEDVNFYWGMWRLLTQTTPGLTDTVTYEHDPNVDERAKWVDGEVVDDLPAFSEERIFEFPDPIGEESTYVISHPEPITFPEAPVAQEKDVDTIITRGAWHDEWKEYERTLHASGAFETEGVDVDGTTVDPVEVMQNQVKAEGQARESEWQPPEELSPETEWTPQTILSAEVTGSVDGHEDETVLHFEQPFPFFDGKEITLMREYGCYVGVPLSVTLQLMADGAVDEDGIFITETSGLDADRYFEEMEARGFTLIEERTPDTEATAPTQD